MPVAIPLRSFTVASDILSSRSEVSPIVFGTGYLAEVLNIMAGVGLVYRWTLAMGYAETRRAKPTAGRYLSAWNPILLLTKGDMEPGDVLGDFYLVHNARDTKNLHDWQQTEKPLKYWLKVLLRPGSLVADPFAGSGTTGVVCRDVALRWIGTEKDAKHYKVARGRLLDESQGSPNKKPPATRTRG